MSCAHWRVNGLLRAETAEAKKEEEPWDSDAKNRPGRATNGIDKGSTNGSTKDEAISNRSCSRKPSPCPSPRLPLTAGDRAFLRSIRVSAD